MLERPDAEARFSIAPSSNYVATDCVAALVGLASVIWCEQKPDETRAPHDVVERWDTDLRSYESLADESKRRKQAETRRLAERVLSPIRRRTVAVYDECLGVYDEIRSHVARLRRDEQMARAALIRAGR